jgi:hypothetical protein
LLVRDHSELRTDPPVPLGEGEAIDLATTTTAAASVAKWTLSSTLQRITGTRVIGRLVYALNRRNRGVYPWPWLWKTCMTATPWPFWAVTGSI